MRALLRMLICVAAVALAFAGRADASPQALLHKAAPQFTRNDLQHRSIDLRSYRGKVVLLTFWATWCAPCQTEIPKFLEWQRTLGPRGFEVLAISMDDDAGPVARLVQRKHVSYPVIMGDTQLAQLYGGILGLPVNFLIDRQGVVQAVFQGESNLESIHGRIQALLRSTAHSGAPQRDTAHPAPRR
ncbi:MAG: TlpA family protein disulfide reductase [Acidobacteriota bacterium]